MLRLAKFTHGSRNNGDAKQDAPNRNRRRIARAKRKWGGRDCDK
jgi:hypothetical protein